MTHTAKTPSLAQLNRQGAGAVLEFVCQNPNCRRSVYVLGDDFSEYVTITELAYRARCTQCDSRDVRVFPLWNNTQGYGR